MGLCIDPGEKGRPEIFLSNSFWNLLYGDFGLLHLPKGGK
jgi:hypothetical protein